MWHVLELLILLNVTSSKCLLYQGVVWQPCHPSNVIHNILHYHENGGKRNKLIYLARHESLSIICFSTNKVFYLVYNKYIAVMWLAKQMKSQYYNNQWVSKIRRLSAPSINYFLSSESRTASFLPVWGKRVFSLWR